MRSEISTLKLGKESSTLAVDALQRWIAVSRHLYSLDAVLYRLQMFETLYTSVV